MCQKNGVGGVGRNFGVGDVGSVGGWWRGPNFGESGTVKFLRVSKKWRGWRGSKFWRGWLGSRKLAWVEILA